MRGPNLGDLGIFPLGCDQGEPRERISLKSLRKYSCFFHPQGEVWGNLGKLWILLVCPPVFGDNSVRNGSLGPSYNGDMEILCWERFFFPLEWENNVDLWMGPHISIINFTRSWMPQNWDQISGKKVQSFLLLFALIFFIGAYSL